MKIAVLPGDGIGPEVTAQAVKVLRRVGWPTPLELSRGADAARPASTRAGVPLPAATLAIARQADAILFGAAGMPGRRGDPVRDAARATACSGCARSWSLFANFRPAFLFPELIGASTLKPEVVEGLDMVILRELTGDVYFGEPRGIGRNARRRARGFNTMRYSEPEIERIAHVAFRARASAAARSARSTRPTCWKMMQLWREVVTRVGSEYPDVELTHLFVDAARDAADARARSSST